MLSNTPSVNVLSERETQVLNLIAYEHTTSMIARELFISDHTVVSHRKRLLEKLKAKNTAGLIRRAYEQGLLSSSNTNI